MGPYTCEKTGKCPTGMIAATGLDSLQDILQVFQDGGDKSVEVDMTVRGQESLTFSFKVDNIDELIEILSLMRQT